MTQSGRGREVQMTADRARRGIKPNRWAGGVQTTPETEPHGRTVSQGQKPHKEDDTDRGHTETSRGNNGKT